mgnify:CR=1 FL=1
MSIDVYFFPKNPFLQKKTIYLALVWSRKDQTRPLWIELTNQISELELFQTKKMRLELFQTPKAELGMFQNRNLPTKCLVPVSFRISSMWPPLCPEWCVQPHEEFRSMKERKFCNKVRPNSSKASLRLLR